MGSTRNSITASTYLNGNLRIKSHLVILLLIFTTLQANIVRQKRGTGKKQSSNDLKEKIEVDEQYNLNEESFRRDSLSASSVSSETSSVFRRRMNSQEAVEKMLHMLADPTTSRR